MPHKRSTNIAVGTLVAAGIGYALGILTAPKSGKETRRNLQRSASHAIFETEKTLKSAYSDLSKLITSGKQKTKSLTNKAKNDLSVALQNAQSVKDKARRLLSSIHEGDAEDSDLRASVKELQKSIKELKKRIDDVEIKKTKKA